MPPPLTPKILALVGINRLDRGPARGLTAAHVEALIAVARKPNAFRERVSAPRAIQALARGAKAEAAVPVLGGIVGDEAAPTTHRVVAARELGGIATPEAERALIRRVESRDPRVQEAVLRGLGAFAGPGAMRQLARLTEIRDPFVRRQLTLTRALIAHREGLDGPFLPALPGKMRKPEDIQRKAAVTLSLKTARATATDLERLTGSTYGIKLGPRAAALKCERVEWTVFFNRELGTATIAQRLFARPWIAALLGRWFIEGKAAVAQLLVLTRPEGDAARIDVVRTDGELMYTGRVAAARAGITFSIADVERPGTAPTNITGRMSSTEIALVGVVASARRIDTRSTEAVVAG